MGKIIKYWPKDEILKALQALPKDKPLNFNTIQEYHKQGLICEYSGLGNKFGSFRNACLIAGVECGSKSEKYTKVKLKLLLKNGFIKYGKINPTELIHKIEEDNKCYIGNAVRRLYGTISAALADAEVEYINYYWTNERIINTLRELNQKYGPLYIVQISDFRRQKLICGGKLIRDRFGSIQNAARIAGFNFVEPQNVGHLFNGKKGRTETEILDNLEIQYGIKILRQYRLIIEDNIYFVDGYDQINNVVYEIDENYHKYEKQQLLDRLKEEKIKNKLNCQIIRIKNY